MRIVATLALMGSLTLPAHGQTSLEDRDFALTKAVITEVNRYTHVSMFDDVGVQVTSGTVTLYGKVTDGYKRDTLGRLVARLDGVEAVDNRIELLPALAMDRELRVRIANAIYGHPVFLGRSARANPPIHIIVERGEVTLTGVVAGNVERQLAASLAAHNGAKSIVNELRTDAEVDAGIATES